MNKLKKKTTSELSLKNSKESTKTGLDYISTITNLEQEDNINFKRVAKAALFLCNKIYFGIKCLKTFKYKHFTILKH